MIDSKKGFQNVVGLDLSSTAIQVAKENHVKEQLSGVEFAEANFFAYPTKQNFHFVFDYLFFTALEPKDRPQWAEAMKRCLNPEKGIFSLRTSNDNSLEGPPYPVNVEDYEKVLPSNDWQLIDVNHVSV